ncbi:MAG: YodC family protein [Kluyvera intermedia]
MVFLVSDEVRPKKGGPRMVVTGYSSGMIECRWYDGFGVKREAFREDELIPGNVRKQKKSVLIMFTPGLCRAF